MRAPTQRLDLVKLGTLSFEAPDESRFPALRLARHALELGRTAGAILNAANEVAVEGFVGKRLGFLEIAALVEDVLDAAERSGLVREALDLSDVLEVDGAARRLARELLGRYG